MSTKTYAAALVEGIHQFLAENPNALLIGRSIVGHGAHADAQKTLTRDYAERIIDPPTSEGAVTSMAVGAAMAGVPMFFHVGTASFLMEAWNQVLHEASVARFMSGGQMKVPVVIHAFHGLRGGGSGQHSISPYAMMANNPGLKVIMPTAPADAKGMVRAALMDDDPVMFMDHSALLGQEGEVPDEPYETPLGVAEVRRTGTDVTIVACSRPVLWAMEAAEALAADGIDAEVIDLRTVAPLDAETVLASVAKTGHLVTVDECPQMCSVGSEVAALVAEQGFGTLKGPVQRVARMAVPVGFSPPLEKTIAPGPDKIIAAVKRTSAKAGCGLRGERF